MSKYILQGPDGAAVPVKECARCSGLITANAEQAHALWHEILSDLAKRVNGVGPRRYVFRPATPQPLTDINAGGTEDSPV